MRPSPWLRPLPLSLTGIAYGPEVPNPRVTLSAAAFTAAPMPLAGLSPCSVLAECGWESPEPSRSLAPAAWTPTLPCAAKIIKPRFPDVLVLASLINTSTTGVEIEGINVGGGVGEIVGRDENSTPVYLQK